MAAGVAKLLVSLVVGAAVACAWIGVRNRHRFRYLPGPLGVAELGQMARDGFLAEEFEVEPGVLLRGLVRPPTGGARTWLWIFAGNGSDLLAGARELGANLAADTGWGVATWAYRGFDGSGGTPDAAAFAADAEQLWQRLQTTYGAEPQRIHLVSFSLGTALALRIAALSTARGASPASLVLLGPYDRIQVTQDAWWAPWSIADRYDALAYAAKSQSPALLVWGSLDDAYPPGTPRALGAALGPRSRLLELPGRGHAGWLNDEDVLKQVREFLREHTPS